MSPRNAPSRGAVDIFLGRGEERDDARPRSPRAAPQHDGGGGVFPLVFNNESALLSSSIPSSHHYGQHGGSRNLFRDDSAYATNEEARRRASMDTQGSAALEKHKKKTAEEVFGNKQKGGEGEAKRGEGCGANERNDEEGAAPRASSSPFETPRESFQTTRQEQTLRKLQTMRWSLHDFRCLGGAVQVSAQCDPSMPASFDRHEPLSRKK
jgi:hypothetical protein